MEKFTGMKYQELKDWLKARGHSTTGDKKELFERATALASEETYATPVTSDDTSTPQVGALGSSAISQSVTSSVMVSEHTSSLFTISASSPSASSGARSKYFSRQEMDDGSPHGLVLQQRAKAIEERQHIRERMQHLKKQAYLRRIAEEKEAWEEHMELQNREYILNLKRQEREFSANMDLEREQQELEGQEEMLGLVIGDDDHQEKVPSQFTSQSEYYGPNTVSASVNTVDMNTKPLSSARTNITFAPVSSFGQSSAYSATVHANATSMPTPDTAARSTPQRERFAVPPIHAPGAWRFGTNASSGHVSTVASELSEHFELISMPKPTPMSFSGDPMQYHMFINSFTTNVDSKNVSDATKLCRLFELCHGKARTTINPCALGDASRGYARAKQLLKERFGDDYVISEAYIKKICDGSMVKANSGESLQAFADEVRDCVETLRSMNQLHEVDTRSRLVKLMQRLPDSLQSRWRKKAVYARDTTGEYPNIAMFLRFLEEVTREVNDPIFGFTTDTDRRDGQERKSHQQSKSKQGKVMAVQVEGKSDGEKKEKVKCPQCSGSHPLYVCRDFKKLSASERLQTAKSKRLCYSCLKVANHRMRDCKFERVCGIDGCTFKHSRFLHAGFLEDKTADEAKSEEGSNASDTPAAVSAHVSTGFGCNKKTALPVVAVWATASNGMTAKIYALLDSGSSHTFCSPELFSELQVEGEPTDLNLSTLLKGDKTYVSGTSLSVIPVDDAFGDEELDLPEVYAIDSFPAFTKSVARRSDVQQYVHLQDLPFPEVDAKSVKLLIGQDNPDALIPLEYRRGQKREPYAVRTPLGWTINGPLSTGDNGNEGISFFVQLEQSLYDADIEPSLSPTRELSVNDKIALNVWDQSTTIVDGHYQLDIPFKQSPPSLPNNKAMAEKRLQYLQRRMKKDKVFADKYQKGINEYLTDGHAEKVDGEGEPGMVWYIPHQAVFNPKKPDKFRIVFDCAAVYKGTSINSAVHRGPDFTNKMIGVLLRFREKPVVIVADVKAMYHQVRITPEHRDVLRFLWWEDDEVVTYRMTVSLFGGVWSASAANYALKRTAEDHRGEFDDKVIEAVLSNFYVDDLLQAVDTVEEGIEMSREIRRLLLLRGFDLTKWMSNSREILQSIPAELHAKNLKEVDLANEPLPKERALGVTWSAEDDVLQVNIGSKVARFTKRGLISHYSSVYDPLGMLAPFVLIARIMFRDECKLNKGWDDELEEETGRKFVVWLEKLPVMTSISIPRCIAAPDMDNAISIQMHHFCDASEEAYSAVSYMRIVQRDGVVHSAFIFGKARLSPLKGETIPRLELLAAVLAVENHLMLKAEMKMRCDTVYFWSDSMVVLGWIKNANVKHKRFVGKRISDILEASTAEQWRYVPTSVNPADVGTRGATDLNQWIEAPEFLGKEEHDWPTPPTGCDVAVATATAAEEQDPTEKMIHYFSSLEKLKRSVVWVSKFMRWLKNKSDMVDDVTSDQLEQAEQNIVKYVQRVSFSKELHSLSKGQALPVGNNLYALEPHLDENGLIRVGSRLKYADMDPGSKNQILLPHHHVAVLLVRYIHNIKCLHGGIEYMLSELRRKYWLTKPRALLRRVVKKCVTCRRLGAKAMTQKMADLPKERLAVNSRPFTNTGIDCFGPFVVHRGRSTLKRYGLIFTCLTVRAVHLEVLPALTTDAFINALRRFICRRGKPKRLLSDNGTNFVGAYRELGVALRQVNDKRKLRNFLLQEAIEWSFNPPAASHMGGAWERLIRSVRRSFNAVICNARLDDFELQTIMCEIEAVVNNRPITKVSDDQKDEQPLTPSHLLCAGSTGTLPPAEGENVNQYRRRWRYIQYLVDSFWRRWISEYLPSIQHRQKWIADVPNAHVNDVVLIMDELTHRNEWAMGRIASLNAGPDGRVRSAVIQTLKGRCTRPVAKLCLLESCEN